MSGSAHASYDWSYIGRSGVRRRLWELIGAAPGLHLRELQRQSRAATGETVYHLDVLERHGLIRSERFGGLRRFFSPEVAAEDRAVFAALHSPARRQIVLLLLAEGRLTHRWLVEATRLAPSTLTWHLRHLRQSGVLEMEPDESAYMLVRPAAVRNLLLRYRVTFSDSLVSSFVDAWGQLSL